MLHARTAGALGALALAFAPSLAHGQGTPVYQNGSAIQNHLAKFSTNGRIEDVGGLYGDANGNGGVAPFAILDRNALGLCFNTGPTKAPAIYSSLCFGHDANGNPVFAVNGTTYAFTPGNGNVHGPASSTVGHLAIWNSADGTLLADGGPIPPQAATVIVAPTDGSDAAPAIQAAIVSNAHLILPAGNYTLCSTSAGAGYPATGLAAVYVHNKANFVLDMSGAIIRICDAIAAGPGIAIFQFDQNSNYSVIEGNIVGNLNGRTGAGNTVGFQTFNAVGARYMRQIFTGDWSSTAGGGVPFDGDYIVNSVFSGARGYGVTIGYDLAFLLNVAITDNFMVGAYHGGPGVTGISVVYDTPNLGSNHTPYSIPDSQNVRISGNAIGAFASGWVLASGSDYTLSDNFWQQNVGTASQPGTGGLVSFNNGGTFTSVGHPPRNIAIRGDHYVGNGHPTSGGGGILIQAPPGAGSDVIDGLSIDAFFTGNQPNAIEASLTGGGSSAKLSNLDIRAHCIGGGVQTECVGVNVIAARNVSNDTVVAFSTIGGAYSALGNQINGGPGSYESSIVDPGIAIGSGAGDCGTSPAIAGSNMVGRVTVGTAANGGKCTVTFTTTMHNRPICSVVNESSGARTVFPVTSLTTLAITAATTLNANDVLSYACRTYQ